MDKSTKDAIIVGAVAGTVISSLSKKSDSEVVLDEMKRRRLMRMTTEELELEYEITKETENTQSIILFWVMMIIGCFIFPLVCIPICLLGSIYALVKNYKQERESLKNRVGKKLENKHNFYCKLSWALLIGSIVIPFIIAQNFSDSETINVIGIVLLFGGLLAGIFVAKLAEKIEETSLKNKFDDPLMEMVYRRLQGKDQS